MLKNINEAVRMYRNANAGGPYSAFYGRLMLDRSTGEIWCDEFYSLGHTSYKVYDDKSVIDLGAYITDKGERVTLSTVKRYALSLMEEWAR